MFRRMYDGITDNFEGIVAFMLVILLTVVALGIAFGALILTAWVIMMVYNTLANTFNWPLFSIWFWAGAVFVLNWLRKGLVTIFVKKGDD